MAERTQQSVDRQIENEDEHPVADIDVLTHQIQQVIFDDCQHKIRDSGFNERRELGLALDNHGSEQGIEALMRVLLGPEDFLKVWRSGRGGVNPALGFLCYLSTTNLSTLEKLEDYVRSVGDKAFPELLELISKEIENDTKLASMPLQKLPFNLLERMAGEMTARPDPKFQPMQYTWKNIAGNVPLDQETIDNLAASRPRNYEETLTEALLRYVSTSNPESKLVWLAKGLQAIGRIDLLNKDIFKDCRSKRCVRFLGDRPDGRQVTSLDDFQGDLC